MSQTLVVATKHWTSNELGSMKNNSSTPIPKKIRQTVAHTPCTLHKALANQ